MNTRRYYLWLSCLGTAACVPQYNVTVSAAPGTFATPCAVAIRPPSFLGLTWINSGASFTVQGESRDPVWIADRDAVAGALAEELAPLATGPKPGTAFEIQPVFQYINAGDVGGTHASETEVRFALAVMAPASKQPVEVVMSGQRGLARDVLERDKRLAVFTRHAALVLRDYLRTRLSGCYQSPQPGAQ